MPLVSVIMPSYNHERFVSEAIESVLNQTLGDLELIIIDDASKDNSRRIIEDFSKKDSRVKAIFHERNMGIARTLNDGIKAAKGKFIAFHASDDLWVKDKLEKELKVLEQNEDFVVWTEVEIIDAQGSPTGQLGTQRWGASNRSKSGDIFEELLRGNFIPNRILKKENVRDIRFNEALRYLNDWQFDVDLARRYIYYFIPEPLVKKREHGSNTADRDRQGYSKDLMVICQYFLDEYPNDMSNVTKSVIYLQMAQCYRGLGNNDMSNVTKSRIYLQMAQCYKELGNNDMSNVTKSRIYLQMAKCYKELGNKHQAKDFLHSAKYFIANCSDQTSKRETSAIYLGMVSAYLSLGNRVQALKCLYTAVKLDPSLLRTLLSRVNPKYLLQIVKSLVVGRT